MEAWLSFCGLFAAFISMMLDVAQFWKKVVIPLVVPVIPLGEADLGGFVTVETVVMVEIKITSG